MNENVSVIDTDGKPSEWVRELSWDNCCHYRFSPFHLLCLLPHVLGSLMAFLRSCSQLLRASCQLPHVCQPAVSPGVAERGNLRGSLFLWIMCVSYYTSQTLKEWLGFPLDAHKMEDVLEQWRGSGLSGGETIRLEMGDWSKIRIILSERLRTLNSPQNLLKNIRRTLYICHIAWFSVGFCL